MLVVDGVRDHHVSNVRIEGGRLPEHVHAGHPCRLLRDLPQDVIGGFAERVVDVEDARVRLAQLSLVYCADPRVDRRGVQLGQHEDLRRRVDSGADGRDVAHPIRRLQLGAPLAQTVALRVNVENLAGPVVQPVLSRGTAVAGLELSPLGVQVSV